MSKFKKKLPKFKNQAKEREFWLSHDSADYIDWSKAENVELKNLKPVTKHISS